MMWRRHRHRTPRIPPEPRPNRLSRQAGARRCRARWWRPLRTIVLWGGVLAAGGWTSLTACQMLSPHLDRAVAIHQIAVTGTTEVSRSEIIEQLKLSPRDTLLTINTTRLALRVESLPWVKRAIVRRELPHTLAVHVVERRPAAVLRAPTVTLLLDEEAHPLVELAQMTEPALPVLVGIQPRHILNKEPEWVSVARKGIEVGTLLTRTFQGQPEVDVADPSNIVAYVQGLRLQFGTSGFEDKWDLYRKMEPHLAGTMGNGRGEARSEIDLRYPGKVIVRERG